MASGYAPDTLNERHKRMAELEVLGLSNVEIGERLGLHPNRVGIIKQSPLYQALRDARSKETTARNTFNIAAKFDEQAEATFDRWKELRDQDGDLGVAARMTAEGLDRYLPKRTAVDVDSTIRLRISVEQMAAMRIAAAEDDGLEPDAIDVEACAPPAPAGLKLLDAAIGEAAAREAAAAADEESA